MPVQSNFKGNRNLLNNFAAAFIIFFCFVIIVYFVYIFLPVGVDWKGAYRRASMELLKARSPYSIPLFFNPPWALLPLLPIATLSPALGSAIMYAINLFAFVFVMIRLKTNTWLILPILFFSGMLANSHNGNIEGIIAIGYILPPHIGLFFVLAKPQIGIAVAIFWFYKSWKAEGLKKSFILLLPVSIAYVISFMVFGLWILNSWQITDVWWNASIWPMGIPVGLFLLGMAIRNKEIKFAIAASPFFAPYLTGHSWAVVWLGIISLIPQSGNLEYLKNRMCGKRQ